ncbi:MAG TPA: lysophospholipid acyltransferase family protein [Gemmatimonadaceae bacterium]|nr:lysophospholipid acyltransferase family protein [Gemmatimonadaceae bacterium]
MRTLLTALTLAILTPTLGAAVIVAGLLRVRDRPGGIFDWAPRVWCRSILRAAGVRVRLHNAHHMPHDEPRIYVANHVSWFDIFTLASLLPHYKFVAKAELFRIPIFGTAARAAGMISIERDNRKSAFASYDRAAEQIRRGASVVVFPEGTRGRSYAMRPFKKGPFVLAVAAQVPVVPVIMHGTIPIQPKGSFRVRPGTVDVHFLEPITTRGMTYDDRDRLARETWQRMATAFEREYHITSTSSERDFTLAPSP